MLERLCARVVALCSIDAIGASVAAIAVHDDGNVLGHGAAADCRDEAVLQPLEPGLQRRETARVSYFHRKYCVWKRKILPQPLPSCAHRGDGRGGGDGAGSAEGGAWFGWRKGYCNFRWGQGADFPQHLQAAPRFCLTNCVTMHEQTLKNPPFLALNCPKWNIPHPSRISHHKKPARYTIAVTGSSADRKFYENCRF